MEGVAECSVSTLLNMVLMIVAEVREVDTGLGDEEEATSTGPGLLSVKGRLRYYRFVECLRKHED